MVSTDTFYLPYHKTTSHFPGHRCVVVGYDEASESVLIADRKFDTYQRCSFDELRRARNAPDYPWSCNNQYGDLEGEMKLGRPLDEAASSALRRTALGMLEPDGELPAGIPALRRLAGENPRVVFAGRVSDGALASYYRHAEALIVPSVCYETFGIILIEAMSAGAAASPMTFTEFGAPSTSCSIARCSS